jgi:hypothetical protein
MEQTGVFCSYLNVRAQQEPGLWKSACIVQCSSNGEILNFIMQCYSSRNSTAFPVQIPNHFSSKRTKMEIKILYSLTVMASLAM